MLTPAQWVSRFRARGFTQAEIGRWVGVTQPAIARWEAGKTLPSLQQAAVVAEMTGSEGFAASVREARMRTCTGCGQVYVMPPHTSRAGYCGARCRNRAANERHRRPQQINEVRRLQADVAAVRAELKLYKDTALAMCMACEPDGACRTPSCKNRAVSPFPLADARLRIA